MNVKEQELRKKVKAVVESHKEEVDSDRFRLRYHIMPQCGFLNDPNGLIYFQNKYHVFFQWNPFSPTHGAKYWDHVTSDDLLNWKQEEYALAPVEWYEKDGCYSGSAIEHESKLYLFYTGNVKDESGNREAYQCLAVSEDGIHFEKYGPVLEVPKGYTAHFRDPKVWKVDSTFYMIIGAQTEAEEGAAVLFASDDLVNWTNVGPITMDFKEFGYMWECPDLFCLNGRDVLLFSPQGLEKQPLKYQNLFQSGYCVGKMDYTSALFDHGEFEELDYGFDFYAPQTFQDNHDRRLLIAWMGSADENDPSGPPSLWLHALTMPRELKVIDDKLFQSPAKELEKLRSLNSRKEHVVLTENSFTVTGDLFEISLQEISIEADFTIMIRDNASFTYQKKNQLAILSRLNTTIGSWENRYCQLQNLDSLRLFLDSSSLEIFLNNGEKTFSSRYFPEEHITDINLSSKGNVSFQFESWDYMSPK